MYVLSKWIIKRKVINPHSWVIWNLLSRKVFIYTYIYIYMCVCVCICVYIYVFVCIYICVCVCIYVCVCVYIYVCVCVCVYMCVCVCICIVFNTSWVLDVYLSMDYQATENWSFLFAFNNISMFPAIQLMLIMCAHTYI